MKPLTGFTKHGCMHRYGFLHGLEQMKTFSGGVYLISKYNLLEISWNFLLNLVLIFVFFFTYKKTGSTAEKIFKIQVGAFYGINILSAFTSCIDMRFMVTFQKAPKPLVFMSLIWLLYWINQAVDYFYDGPEQYHKNVYLFDLGVLGLYFLSLVRLKVLELTRHRYPEVNTRFLGWEIDRSNSDYYILHWKALVVFFNLRLRNVIVFNDYLLFSSFYLIVLGFCFFLFYELRCRGYRGRHDKLRFVFDILALVTCGIVAGCSFGWSYVFIQFYKEQKFKVLCLILLGILILIIGLFTLILSLEKKTTLTSSNVDGVRYGFTRYNTTSRWYNRMP